MALILGVPLVSWAQDNPAAGAPAGGAAGHVIQLPNPISITDPRVLIGQIIGAALGIVGSIAFAMFLWGGFLWMTSAGNSEKVSKGKMVILWAAIGLAVIFTSYALVSYVLKGLKPQTSGVQQPPPATGVQQQP